MNSEYNVKWDVYSAEKGCCITQTKCFEDVELTIEKVRQLRNNPAALRVHVIEHIYYRTELKNKIYHQGENLEAELKNKATKKITILEN